ncbi:MAG: immunoglobulin domain-containing protein, partial [Verrucomicrobia bacterium]|nr:immunoglobulin domain-containing protein [Verrucomicrobiota bacterium]
MKKVLLFVALIVTTRMVLAQGTVAFVNSATGLVKQWTSSSDSSMISVPSSGGYVQLLAAPAGTPQPGLLLYYSSLTYFLAANPGWMLVATAAIGPVAGRFNGGVVTIPNIPRGENAQYFVIGWTGSAPTWDAAVTSGAFMGQSATATTATGDPTTIPPGIPVSLQSTFQGMTLTWPCLGPYFMGITTQPANQTVMRGATVTFYVAATACPPPYNQWYFNGASIPGATGSSLQISNAQLADAGDYWVVLSNPAWAGWPYSGGTVHVSERATLTVLAEPIITSPPQSQTAEIGSAVGFRVHATNTLPLSYEWFFNNTTAITGSTTNNTLLLTNAQPSQAGAYTVLVTNIAGAVTSPPAMLSVIPPVERRIVPGLSLLGQPGSLLSLDEADTLNPSPNWVTFDSVTLTNTSQWYFDLATPLPPQRFYRSSQSGSPSVIPTLILKMVPALTLTGSAGSSVRVDYINQ